MASNIFLTTATGTTICIDGATNNPWDGTGTPWTSQATTPIRIAMNENAGAPSWTPQAAKSLDLFTGGSPFHDGQSLVYRSYPNVTESIPLRIAGTNHNNAVALLQMLRTFLNTTLYKAPCILGVQPDGALNIGYTEILSANLQETADFINEESKSSVIRCVLTIVRKPFFGMLSSGETAVNGVTLKNTGTGASNNVVAYTTGLSGELQYEGQPMNITFGALSANAGSRMYMASIYSRTYSTTGAGIYDQGTGSTHVAGGSISNNAISLIPAQLRKRLKLRTILRTNAMPANARLYLQYGIQDKSLFTSPNINPQSGDTVIDMGFLDLSSIQGLNDTTMNLSIQMSLRSTDGTLTTMTLNSCEFLLYYEFLTVDNHNSITSLNDYLRVQTFVEQTGRPVLPFPQRSGTRSTNTTVRDTLDLRGEIPRYYPDASLWVAWNAAITTTAVVTAKMAPLWLTLRGND